MLKLTIITATGRYQSEFELEQVHIVAAKLREWRRRFSELKLTALVDIGNVTHIIKL